LGKAGRFLAGHIGKFVQAHAKRTVRGAVPGPVVLSGGQGDVRATKRPHAMNQSTAALWKLSGSFGCALQVPVLTAHPAMYFAE